MGWQERRRDGLPDPRTARSRQPALRTPKITGTGSEFRGACPRNLRRSKPSAQKKWWRNLAPPLLLRLVNTTSRSRINVVDGFPATLLGADHRWEHCTYRPGPARNL